MEKKMFLKASNLIFEKARILRNNPTHAELMMWFYLKQKPPGHRFRRQHPISIYVADFYCHSLKMIIEIDGNVHAENEVRTNDETRQKNLEAEGISFLRFTNILVEKSLEKVISIIENYIRLQSSENKGKPL